MDTVWKTNGVKRVDCCPYCTLAFCSVISISTQGLITPLHYTMSGAPGSRLRHAPFDWLWLGFSAQPHPKGLAGKQEEGPETAHIIPDSISNHPTKLDPSGGRVLCVCRWMDTSNTEVNVPIKTRFSNPASQCFLIVSVIKQFWDQIYFLFIFWKHKNTWQKKS